ncbi:hypothetical protein HK101_002948 [Irineochytrium annulatum]|nr:hypothetical protein HK101_002948 [Irineochytrium annulatum]
MHPYCETEIMSDGSADSKTAAESPRSSRPTPDAESLHSRALAFSSAGHHANAMAFHRRAAALGHAASHLAIHSLHARNLAPVRDDRAALRHLRAAAEMDHVPAMALLGCMLVRDNDESEGVELLMRCAEMGDVGSMMGMAGWMAARGSRAEEWKWMERAAQLGDDTAREIVGTREERLKRIENVARGLMEGVMWEIEGSRVEESVVESADEEMKEPKEPDAHVKVMDAAGKQAKCTEERFKLLEEELRKLKDGQRMRAKEWHAELRAERTGSRAWRSMREDRKARCGAKSVRSQWIREYLRKNE